MIKRLFVLGSLLMLVLGLIACQAATASESLKQTVGALSSSLSVTPYPPVPMQKSVLELRLQNVRGEPLSGADVRFDLTMPGMEMPPNRPQATESETGLYRADVMFTMAGKWQIQAQVVHPSQTAQLTFIANTR